ncbi:klaroid protein-like isoform X2 [Schistocerca piceifrons]|uniref:klaroid protein-like isoform X2 n=1 Tax=Schistocerca piceifrons TaxID=274613 RepID=UPI001F5F09A4|nr:klaroid protein-like isoform X2 [Schistocerca piceifrons]
MFNRRFCRLCLWNDPKLVQLNQEDERNHDNLIHKIEFCLETKLAVGDSFTMSNVVCAEHTENYCCDTYVRPTLFVLSACAVVLVACPLVEHYYSRVLHKIESEIGGVSSSLNQLSKVTEELSASQKNIEKQFEETLSKGLEENRKQICNMKKELEEIIKRVERMIFNELQKYDADKVALPDFALENTGGSVITTRGTQTKQISVSLMGTSLCTQKNLPNRIIQANVLPGECWAFHGSSGSAAIKLITEIYVTAVTLEHIPQALSPTGERTSAPKEFSIWGITSVDSDEDAFCFGQFLYDLKGPPVQTFKVKNYSPKLYSMTEMRIHSNHGNPNYTCVYRLRIHGTINNMSCGVF